MLKPYPYGRNLALVQRTGKPHISFHSSMWTVLCLHRLFRFVNPRDLPADLIELDARAQNFCRTRNNSKRNSHV